MKKTKYYFSLFDNSNPFKIIQKLNEYNLKGYELTRVGDFFKFELTNNRLKYQIDILPQDNNRIAELDELDYFYVKRHNDYHIVASRNLQAPDIEIEHDSFKEVMTKKELALIQLALFSLGLFISMFTFTSINKLFQSPGVFYTNAYKIEHILPFTLISMYLMLGSIYNLILMRQIKKAVNPHHTISKANKIYHYFLGTTYILSLFMCLYLQLPITTYFMVTIVSLLGLMAYHSKITYNDWREEADLKEILVFVAVYLCIYYSPTIKFDVVPSNFPYKEDVIGVQSSRYIKRILLKETTTDVSWIEDYYGIIKDETIIDDYFEYFIIETERGTRLSNSNVFTNMDLNYALSEKNVPSLSFEEAMKRVEEIEENIWVCEDYMIAKKGNILIRICFEDLEEAKVRMDKYLNY